MSVMNAGILTVSDRSFKGERKDAGGPALRALFEGAGWIVSETNIVPDEKSRIKKVIKDWCDRKKIPLVITTGGTGIGPKDVTPEATREIVEKELPGVCELIRQEGLKHTPFAVLSRGVVGIRKKTLIINLPGSPKGAEQSLTAVIGIIPHALDILRGGRHG